MLSVCLVAMVTTTLDRYQNEREAGVYMNRIKNLENRVKDAELQANEATKRVSSLKLLTNTNHHP